MAEYASSRFTLLCAIAARLPSTIESAATIATTGTQPGKQCQAPLPSRTREADHHHLGENEEARDFEPDAMNAALGVGAPS